MHLHRWVWIPLILQVLIWALFFIFAFFGYAEVFATAPVDWWADHRVDFWILLGAGLVCLPAYHVVAWLAALAEAGIEQIRIGTKEMAFFPDRFDDTFFDMLAKFHAIYPGVTLRLMVHFNHPDEFLKKDGKGGYLEDPAGGLQWLDNTKRAISQLGQRNWINVDNQAPIINGINNDPDALRIMQREMKRNLVENHYFFCGRDIVGHRLKIVVEYRPDTESRHHPRRAGAFGSARLGKIGKLGDIALHRPAR